MTQAQKMAQARYDKRNTRQINLKLTLRTDADVLEKLQKVDSMQGYIKALIRADIERGNND